MSKGEVALVETGAWHADSVHTYEVVEKSPGMTGFKLTFSKLREERGGLWAYVTIELQSHGKREDSDRDFSDKLVFGPVRYNLLTTDRGGAASVIKAMEEAQGEYDWKQLFQDLHSQTILYYQKVDGITASSEFVADPDEEPFLLKPFIAASGVTVLFGMGSVGKSTFAAGLALSVATGWDIFDTFPHGTGNVLWFDYETDNVELFERLAAMRAGMLMDDEPEFDVHHVPLHRKVVDIVDSLKEEVHNYDAKLVVLDSIGNARAGDAMGPTDTIALIKALRSLNVPVLALDHVTKEDQKKGDNITPFGSVYTINGARLLWGIQHHEESSLLPTIRQWNFTNTKANRVPIQSRMGVRMTSESSKRQLYEKIAFKANDGYWELAPDKSTDLLLRTMMEKPEMWWTAVDLAEARGMPLQTVKNIMTGFIGVGTVKTRSMGGKGNPNGYKVNDR